MPASAGSGASDTPDVVKIMVKRLCPPQPSMVLNGGRLSSEEDQNQSSTMRSANARPQRSTIQDPERINGAQSELRVDIDGKQEVIDPEEITYCVCEDVSYGDMVLCELDEKVRSPVFHDVLSPDDRIPVRTWSMVSIGMG